MEENGAIEDIEQQEPQPDIESEPQATEELPPEEDVEVTVESVVEAVLFAADEPISAQRLCNIVEVEGVKKVKDSIKSLNEKYKETNAAFRIEEIAGGFQMMTLSAYNGWLKKLLRARSDNKLSQAALETLYAIRRAGADLILTYWARDAAKWLDE